MDKKELINFLTKNDKYEYTENSEIIKINKKNCTFEPYIEYSKLDLTIKIYYKTLYNDLRYITLFPEDCEIIKNLIEGTLNG